MGDRVLPTFRLVENEALKQHVAKLLSDAFGFRKATKHVPMCHPRSLERHDFEKVLQPNQTRYVVGEKSDGVRYYFVMCLHPSDGEPISLMIDRSFTIFPFSVYARRTFFSATTVVEGELVRASGALHFLMFDAIVVGGVRLSKRPFSERRRALIDAFDVSIDPGLSPSQYDHSARRIVSQHNRVVCSVANVVFTIKPFLAVDQLDLLCRQQHEHASDGLIFMPLDDAIVVGRHHRVYKWKLAHTIDLVYDADEPLVVESPRHAVADAALALCSWNVDDDDTDNDAAVAATAAAASSASPRAHKPRLLHPSRVGVIARDADAVEQAREWLVCKNVIVDVDESLFANGCAFTLRPHVIYEFDVTEVDVHTQSISLTLVRVRPEKDVPNDIETVQKTLLNFQQDITLYELVESLASRQAR